MIGFINMVVLPQYRLDSALGELTRIYVGRKLERVVKRRWDRRPNLHLF